MTGGDSFSFTLFVNDRFDFSGKLRCRFVINLAIKEEGDFGRMRWWVELSCIKLHG